MKFISKEFIRDVKRIIGVEYITELLATVFAPLVHDHNDLYFTETESDARYSPIVHNHDTVYAPIVHDHDARYYTETEITSMFSGLSSVYAPVVHDHDSRYFTETESDARFAPIVHDHDNRHISYASTQTLTQAQIGVASTNSGQAWEKIGARRDFTSTPSQVWTDLSAYRELRLSGFLKPVTGAAIYIRYSIDNGVSYIGTAQYYFMAQQFGAADVSGNTSVVITHTNTLSTLYGGSFDIHIQDFNTSNFTTALSTGYFHNSSHTQESSYVQNICGITTPMNAIQLFDGAGAGFSGSLVLEGMR